MPSLMISMICVTKSGYISLKLYFPRISEWESKLFPQDVVGIHSSVNASLKVLQVAVSECILSLKISQEVEQHVLVLAYYCYTCMN